MSAEPRVVLAVPAFNAARFLPATLASLNAQGDHVRWWLQDGASPDRTAAIGREMARAGDTVVSAPDRSQTDALNCAMTQMGGDIIGFINADDLLAPRAAERVLAYFAAHPEIDLVYGSVEWIAEDGTVTGRHTGRIGSLEEALDIYRVWWRQRQWVQPEVFFRRALWEKAGRFDPGYHLAFDYEFWVRCFLHGARVAHLPEVLAQFRLHAAQKSSAAAQAADEIRRAVRLHLPHARISPLHKCALRAQLGYDDYQSRGDEGARRGFLAEFIRHPQWLLAPPARARVQAACGRLLAGGQ